MNFEFMDYTATPGEKHLGIAKVKCWGKIVLRFKIVPTKDGASFFPAAASYKITEQGTDRYVPSFVLDSNSDKEDLDSIIKANVKRFLPGEAYIPPIIAVSKGTAEIQYPLPASQPPTQDDLPF